MERAINVRFTATTEKRTKVILACSTVTNTRQLMGTRQLVATNSLQDISLLTAGCETTHCSDISLRDSSLQRQLVAKMNRGN